MTNKIFLKEAYLAKNTTNFYVTTKYKAYDDKWEKIENVTIDMQNNYICNVKYESGVWVWNRNGYSTYHNKFYSTYDANDVEDSFIETLEQKVSGTFFWSAKKVLTFRAPRNGWVKLKKKSNEMNTQTNNWYVNFEEGVVQRII